MADFTIETLRGGVNNTDPPSSLSPDQCVEAENVEFNLSMLGEKRKGTSNVTLGTVASTLKVAPFLFRHLPGTALSDAELWALFTPLNGSQEYSLQRKTTAWSTVSPIDDIDVTNLRHYQLSAASLHGKMFLAFKSVGDVDRLHVWDGTTLRRVGIIEPAAAPSVANTGSGSYSGTRYFRVRYTVQDGSSATLLRSEPTDATTFAPSGSGSAARVTKPAATSPSERETHWEVEASIDNNNFYRIATVAVGTTTYDDSVAFNVGYAAAGTLSADSGDYDLIWSAKYVTTDEDRLVFVGSHEDPELGSTVGWTPVLNDPGDGNDERIPLRTNNLFSLDGRNGGEITGISRSINGYMFAFKLGRIYKIWRTQNIQRAYEWLAITESRGALPGSLVEGIDQLGRPALYFLDPLVGPCRLGAGGLQTCGFDVLKTWRTVHVDAERPCHGVYYADSRQVRWWVTTDDAESPNQMIVVQVNQMREKEDGVRRGWSLWSTGRSTTAYSSCMYSDNIESNAARSQRLVPFVGLAELDGDRNLIQQCESGFLDSGETYSASVKTRPYLLAGLLNKFGVLAGAILARAASGVSIALRVETDFGLDEKLVPAVDLTPEGTEGQVIRPIDNLSEGSVVAAQIEFGDLESNSGIWEINQIAFKNSPEETA